MSIRFLGQFLLEQGKIIREELLDALKLQKSMNAKIGTIALEENYLTQEQIDSICICQHNEDKLFGEIAVEKGYITQEQLNEILTIQKNEHFSLSDALIQKGYLTVEELQAEMKFIQERAEAIETKKLQILQTSRRPEVENAFLNSTLKLLRRIVHIDLECFDLQRDRSKVNNYVWNIAQEFYGDVSGIYILSMREKSLLKIASEIIQEQQRTIDDLSKDSGKEFVNMLVGNAAVLLSEKNTKITINAPQIYSDFNSIELNGEEFIAATLVSPDNEAIQCIINYS